MYLNGLTVPSWNSETEGVQTVGGTSACVVKQGASAEKLTRWRCSECSAGTSRQRIPAVS